MLTLLLVLAVQTPTADGFAVGRFKAVNMPQEDAAMFESATCVALTQNTRKPISCREQEAAREMFHQQAALIGQEQPRAEGQCPTEHCTEQKIGGKVVNVPVRFHVEGTVTRDARGRFNILLWIVPASGGEPTARVEADAANMAAAVDLIPKMTKELMSKHDAKTGPKLK